METIPQTENALVLRTDYSDDAAWEKVCAAIRRPVGVYRFLAYVEFLDDVQYEGIGVTRLLALIPEEYAHSFILIVDGITISYPEHPLLVVDLYDQPGRSFRAIPGQIQGIENNLSIANMDFRDFADAVDGDGVFRGFPEG